MPTFTKPKFLKGKQVSKYFIHPQRDLTNVLQATREANQLLARRSPCIAQSINQSIRCSLSEPNAGPIPCLFIVLAQPFQQFSLHKRLRAAHWAALNANLQFIGC